jgi:hypothetical protein
LDAIQIRTGSEHRLGAVKPLFKQFYCALRAHFNILFCHSGCKFIKTAAKLRKKIDTRKGMPIFFHLEPNLVLDFPSEVITHPDGGFDRCRLVGEQYLSNVVKQTMGSSPNSYIDEALVRQGLPRILLRPNEMSISAINKRF